MGTSRGVVVSIDNPVGRDIVLASKVHNHRWQGVGLSNPRAFAVIISSIYLYFSNGDTRAACSLCSPNGEQEHKATRTRGFLFLWSSQAYDGQACYCSSEAGSRAAGGYTCRSRWSSSRQKKNEIRVLHMLKGLQLLVVCDVARQSSNHRNFAVEPSQIPIGPYGTTSFEVGCVAMEPCSVLSEEAWRYNGSRRIFPVGRRR